MLDGTKNVKGNAIQFISGCVYTANTYTILVYLLLVDKKTHLCVVTLFLRSCRIGLNIVTVILHCSEKFFKACNFLLYVFAV